MVVGRLESLVSVGEGHGTHSFQSGMLGHGVLLLAVLTAVVLWGSALCCPFSAAASAQIADPKLLRVELDKASVRETGARESFAAPGTSRCWSMWRAAAGPLVLQFPRWVEVLLHPEAFAKGSSCLEVAEPGAVCRLCSELCLLLPPEPTLSLMATRGRALSADISRLLLRADLQLTGGTRPEEDECQAEPLSASDIPGCCGGCPDHSPLCAGRSFHAGSLVLSVVNFRC